MTSSFVWMRSSRCGRDLTLCGWAPAEFLWMRSSRVVWMRSSRVCVDEIYPSVWMRSSRVCGWDLAECLERLTANAVVATALGSNRASSDTVESERRQMRQCWISYIKNIQKIPPLKLSSVWICVITGREWMLKVPKCEIFLSLSDSCHFYTIKPPWIHCKGKR